MTTEEQELEPYGDDEMREIAVQARAACRRADAEIAALREQLATVTRERDELQWRLEGLEK